MIGFAGGDHSHGFPYARRRFCDRSTETAFDSKVDRRVRREVQHEQVRVLVALPTREPKGVADRVRRWGVIYRNGTEGSQQFPTTAVRLRFHFAHRPSAQRPRFQRPSVGVAPPAGAGGDAAGPLEADALNERAKVSAAGFSGRISHAGLLVPSGEKLPAGLVMASHSL